MSYQVLSQDEQDDIIVSFMLSQERDKFCHETNLVRFTEMLKTLPSNPWRTQIEKLKTDTESRLAEVNGLLTATNSQLPPSARITASIGRIKAKG